MYSVINAKYKGYGGSDEGLTILKGNGQLPGRVEILCDTAADLPTLDEINRHGFAPGSIALIADEHAYKILNHQKEWV